MPSDNRRIAIFVPSFGDGGVERMLVNLAGGLADNGLKVDLVVSNPGGPYLDLLSRAVRIVNLGREFTPGLVVSFARYLHAQRPAAILSAKERANRVAVYARRLARVPVRLVFRVGTTTSTKLAGRNRLKRWRYYRSMRRIYPQADKIIAVSQGAAADLAAILKLAIEDIEVIPNPVITPAMFRLAKEPSPHPWLDHKVCPVIIAVGRLTTAKGYPTLIRAFAHVGRRRPCRLIILGEGRQRADLERLAAELGVEDSVSFPGFVANPYSYVSRADLFVLSSVWEGSPNALTEALALGVPVVSTDCPSGPREILQDGRYGPLVPVGDTEALARAILDTLAQPADRAFLMSAVRRYTLESSTRQYMRAFGLS